MIGDTASVLVKVLDFLHWDADAAAIMHAVDNASFSQLQARERNSGFCEIPTTARQPFFRRGRVGSWHDELAPDLVRKLIDTHGDMMRRFGYLDEKGNPTT